MTEKCQSILRVASTDNWGRVQVLAWMHRHKEQHKAWRKKPDIENWFFFSFFPIFLFIFFISCSTWGIQARWRWNGLLWSALPYCAATSRCPTVIFRGIARTQMGAAEETTLPFCKESFFKAITVWLKKKKKKFQHVAQFNENNIYGTLNHVVILALCLAVAEDKEANLCAA